MDKKSSRIRRSRRTRAKIASLGVHRLSVHRTPRHTYAQVFSSETGNVVASASTLAADVKALIKYSGNTDAAATVDILSCYDSSYLYYCCCGYCCYLIMLRQFGLLLLLLR
jgi:ribosomal protein L18